MRAKLAGMIGTIAFCFLIGYGIFNLRSELAETQKKLREINAKLAFSEMVLEIQSDLNQKRIEMAEAKMAALTTFYSKKITLDQWNTIVAVEKATMEACVDHYFARATEDFLNDKRESARFNLDRAKYYAGELFGELPSEIAALEEILSSEKIPDFTNEKSRREI